MTPVILRPLSLFLSKQSTVKPTPQTILRCIAAGTKALAKYKYRLRSTLSISRFTDSRDNGKVYISYE